jgi:thiol-disulfide isomerase/thioredoxin
MFRQSISGLARSAQPVLAKSLPRNVVAPTLSRTFATSRAQFENFGEADKALFDEHVVKGKKLTVVDFHADVSMHTSTLKCANANPTLLVGQWCPPCKMLDPVLSKVMNGEEEADYMKINTDVEQEIAAKYKVSAYFSSFPSFASSLLLHLVATTNLPASSCVQKNARMHAPRSSLFNDFPNER